MQRQSQQASRPAAPNTASLFDGYKPSAGFDEMFARKGQRPVWRTYREQLDRLGVIEFARRWEASQRQIYENGIAFSAYGDEESRPWDLDPLPLLLSHAEWRPIADGLVQRARVLQLVLADLYGPQQLIADGVLPADLLYGHPGYHACLHTPTEGEAVGEDHESLDRHALQLYAADLGRSPDGQWWVLADRTEAPSGLGFALENRVVVSRMLGEPYRECHVRRLAPFFIQLKETLDERAPDRVRNPSVAILTEGPGYSNYFEDAYLARYLGCTLVEGGDLTVRNRRLWMKTLAGLEAIDALLRRPNTELCDPLELGGASPSGVAGLIQASRDENVLMANPLGSGLVESPVFMAFLPRLCQALLGEPLALPGVATWWCGEASSLSYVLENLDRLAIKPAYRLRGDEGPIMQRIKDATPEQLAEWIRERPREYVAQEQVERSKAPVWSSDGLASDRVALRAFAVAAGDSFTVMEGALGRLTDVDPLELSLDSGEGSKDVWIVGDEPPPPHTLLVDDDESTGLVRIGAELPSRVADHSFWLGRRLERADASARLARTVATRLTSEGDPALIPELPALLRAIAEQGQIEPGYLVDELRGQLPELEKNLPAQVLNHQQPESLSATIDQTFRTATEVRDRLSRDAWRVILRMSNKMRAIDSTAADITDLLNITDELIVDLAAVGGMVFESMTRAQFYRFLDVGRRIERAVQIATLIKTCLVDAPTTGSTQGPPPRSLLEAMLDWSDSLMTYRSRYRANLQLSAVLDLLITDDSNPRSLAWQLNALERHVSKLPRADKDQPGVTQEQRLALSMTHALKMTDIEAVAEVHELGRGDELAALLDRILRDLPALSDAVSLKYLAHAGPPKQLAPM